VTPPIQRVRYYDGEFLRAYDFAAEQGYHVDMRRRLNMSLHQHGVVEGLKLMDATTGGIHQVSVEAGMAIDPYGREIYLFAPYTFNDTTDAQANGITDKGIYEVWLQYSRTAQTPPAAGYANCNQTSQTTRWQENAKIVLLSKSTPTTGGIPSVIDDISESDTPDPDTSYGVFLGKVHVRPGSTKGVFKYIDPTPGSIKYVGLRAQHIRPPDYSADPSTAAATFTSDQSLSGPSPIGVEVHGNISISQNLIVGPNFVLNPPTLDSSSSALPPTVPGGLKVGGDAYFNKKIYAYQKGATSADPDEWLDLVSLIKNVAAPPDIQVGSATISSASAPTGNMSITLTTSLTNFLTPQMLVSVNDLQFDTQTNVNTIFSNASPAGSGQLGITVTAVPTPGSGTFTINWKITPNQTSSTGSQTCPITRIVIGYIAIFYPGP
jgi:hypothetical protein